jgi:hypothetical protein
MPFMGELQRATAYTINIDNGAVGVGQTAVTILKINRRDNIASAETALVAAGARLPIDGMAGARIDRMLIHVNPPKGATVNVDVIQGTLAFSETFIGDGILVFETIP